MYGSNFWMVTRNPLDCKSLARDAAMIPLPREDVTPPVTKIYLAITAFFCKLKVTLEENARPGKDDEYFQEVVQSYAFLRSVKTRFSTFGGRLWTTRRQGRRRACLRHRRPAPFLIACLSVPLQATKYPYAVMELQPKKVKDSLVVM